MPAAQKDFIIEQGATFERILIWKDSTGTPVDVSAYSAKMQIRDCDALDTVLLELSTGNGRIILNTNPGEIKLLITAVDTSAITFKSGVYDLVLTSTTPAYVKRLLKGVVTLDKWITQ